MTAHEADYWTHPLLCVPIFDEVREKLLTDQELRDWLELPEREILTFLNDLLRPRRSATSNPP